MNPRPEHLADFERPPAVETVLSVQFEPLPLLQTAHFGLLWNEFRMSFPKTEERPLHQELARGRSRSVSALRKLPP